MEGLLKLASSRLDPAWEHGEVVAMQLASGKTVTISIPDFTDANVREPLENACLARLAADHDTRVIACAAVITGGSAEIPSWNLRSGLVRLNEDNLQTQTVLWGGGDVFHVKQFCSLLPPKKNQ